MDSYIKASLLILVYPLHTVFFYLGLDETFRSNLLGLAFVIYLIPCVKYYFSTAKNIKNRRAYLAFHVVAIAAFTLVIYSQFIPRAYTLTGQDQLDASPFTPEWANVSGVGYGWPSDVYISLEQETYCCGSSAFFLGSAMFNATLFGFLLALFSLFARMLSKVLAVFQRHYSLSG